MQLASCKFYFSYLVQTTSFLLTLVVTWAKGLFHLIYFLELQILFKKIASWCAGDNFVALFNIGIIQVSHLHILLQLDKSSIPNWDFGMTVKSPHRAESERFKLLQPLFSRVTKKSVFTILFLRFTLWNNELSLDMFLILLDTWPHLKMSAVSVWLNTFNRSSSGKSRNFDIFSDLIKLVILVH